MRTDKVSDFDGFASVRAAIRPNFYAKKPASKKLAGFLVF